MHIEREKLKEARHAAGLSQKSLAELVGVSQSTIMRIETGSIIHSYKVSPDEILEACKRRKKSESR